MKSATFSCNLLKAGLILLGLVPLASMALYLPLWHNNGEILVNENNGHSLPSTGEPTFDVSRQPLMASQKSMEAGPDFLVKKEPIIVREIDNESSDFVKREPCKDKGSTSVVQSINYKIKGGDGRHDKGMWKPDVLLDRTKSQKVRWLLGRTD